MTLTSAVPATAVRDHGYHSLRVKQVVQETADTRSYVLDVPAELRAAYSYRAGQFCTFRVPVDGQEQLRCYSMSSSPDTDPDLTVTVKRVPGGVVSNWFLDSVGEGDVLECTRPAGIFCLRDNDRPVVAFCGGSGITPVLGLAKSALSTTARQVTLLYANRSADAVIFDAELERLAAEHPRRLAVTHHLDDAAGFLSLDDVRSFAEPHREDADFYICGPTPFMELVEQSLLDLGVSADRILVERFGALPAPPSTPAASEANDVPGTVTLVLKGQSHELSYVRGDTVLETARRGGLQPPYSCEAGNCATYMDVLKDGCAAMRTNNALTDDEVDEGWILTCQAVLSGPTATVEYESL
ncbi:MAG: FAD-binding oxidoreductase [Mycobacteriales bacterium]